MQDLLKDAVVEVAELLKRFSFDLNEFTAEQLAFTWLNHYPDSWVHLSLVEALYQGRYKAVSVEQILRFWQRRGQPLYHFNHEFERIIRGRLSRNLLTYSTTGVRNTQTVARSDPHAEHDANPQTLAPETIAEVNEPDSAMSASAQFIGAESTWENFSVIPTAVPSSDEVAADLLEFAGSSPHPGGEGAIQPFSDRLKLLSSEESIAFLKLRSFESGTPPHSLLKDAPIQAFRPLSEFETIDKLKWAKLVINKSCPE